MKITLCPGYGCESRHDCVRFLEPPDRHWQSFADFEAISWGGSGCDYFVSTRNLALVSAVNDGHETVCRKPCPGRAA